MEIASDSARIARATCMLDALLLLSRSLTGAKQGGMLADTLDGLLVGTGCSRGAVFVATGGVLELVGEHGLSDPLRSSLQRLPLGSAPWFLAQRAAQTRKLIVDRQVAAATSGPIDRVALAVARWEEGLACPVVAGRELFGVVVLAWPAAEQPDHRVAAVVEIGCHMAALQMAHRGDEREHREARRRGVTASRMMALGVLAHGFVERMGDELAEVARGAADQHRLLRLLRERWHGETSTLDAIFGRAAAQKEAVRRSREAVARFLAACRTGAPERLDLARVAADAMVLVGPCLKARRVEVSLRTAGEHPVVGQQGELIQLFVHIFLIVSGALNVRELRANGEPRPRAFALELRHARGCEVISVLDTTEGGTGAHADLFDDAGRVDDHSLEFAVARQIVVAHEGHIEIDAAGVRCRVVLPSAEREDDAPPRRAAWLPPAPAPAQQRPARPIVLWVEEDDLFREIIAQSLPECDVLAASSAAEAARLLAAGPSPAAIFCNVRLPDRPGHELHADVARRSPLLGERFVFVTEGVLKPEAASYLLASGCSMLMRPIDLDQVKALIFREPSRPSDAAGVSLPRARGPGVPAAPVGLTTAATEPAMAAVRLPARLSEAIDRDSELPPTQVRRAPPGEPRQGVEDPPPARKPAPSSPDERPASLRDRQLTALARVTADTLKRKGPQRGANVLAMLRGHGLSEPEALSVVTFALSTGAIVRDPAPSTVVRAADPAVQKTVLIVDDDFDMRSTLAEVLRDEGYTVETASNGREALDMLRSRNAPHVVVLDLMMPVMDGWQLLDELQRNETLSAIPVVVVSASKIGLNAPGARHVLSKPIDYYRLVTCVDRSATTLSL